MIATFGCRRDGNAYGWWWWLKASNGHSLASAGVSERACKMSARAAAEEKGWDVPELYDKEPS